MGGVEAVSLDCGLRADEPQCLSVITAGIRFGVVLGSGSAAVAEAAAQFEDLALGGFEGLAQLVDFVAVLLFERGQLGGEGANDAARGVVGRGRCRWWGGLLLGPQVFDAVADRGAAVEEVQGDAGGLGQAAEGDRAR